MSNTKNTQLFASTEITGALASNNLDSAQIESLTADPKAFIAGSIDVDLGSMGVSVVANSDKEIHLALPYYDSLNEAQATMLSDSSMEEAAGGEILISLFAFIGAGLAVGIVGTATSVGVTGAVIGGAVGVAAATAVAVGTASEVQKRKGLNLDGSKANKISRK